MMLLQLSAAHGPAECALAVAKAIARLAAEALTMEVQLSLLEQQPGPQPGTIESALFSLEGAAAEALGMRWQGTLQWICISPYRPHHGRKNWFIGAQIYAPADEIPDRDIRYEALRAAGPGGQHVNKTQSAIRAVHIASGLSVKVQSERSQHANKRLARLLLTRKLEDQAQQQLDAARAQRRMAHHQVSRGNPSRCFIGPDFVPR